jgi:hypothetical protein
VDRALGTGRLLLLEAAPVKTGQGVCEKLRTIDAQHPLAVLPAAKKGNHGANCLLFPRNAAIVVCHQRSAWTLQEQRRSCSIEHVVREV